MVSEVKPKGKYIPVGKLNPEQLAKRRADELRRKQTQRARKAGMDLESYRDNIVRKGTLLREKREAKQWEREIVTNERKIRRENLARDNAKDDSMENWKKTSWKIPGVGQKLKRNRKKLRRELRRIYKQREWLNPQKAPEPLPLEMKKVYDMIDNQLHRWEIDGSSYNDPEIFLEMCWPLVADAIDSVDGNKKVYFKLDILLARMNLENGVESLDNSGFNSEMYEMISSSDDLKDYWGEIITTLVTRLSKFQERGSGWVLKKINKLIVSADVYDSIAGSSFIELPKEIKDRKAVINIENKDDSCFPLAVAAALLRNEDPTIEKLNRATNKKLVAKMETLNMKGIKLSVKISDIDKFENQNPGLNVMVFGLTGMKRGNVKISHVRIKRRPDKSLTTVRLLMWGNKTGNFHYSPITNLSRLLFNQISEKKNTKFFCDNCGNPFGSEKVLSEHEEMCFTEECQRTVYLNKTIEFDKWKCTQKVPFAVYSDIESYNVKMDQATEGTEGSQKNTIRLSEQTPSGLGYVVIGPDGFDPKYKKFDNVESYAESLTNDMQKIYEDWFRESKPMTISDEEQKLHDKTTKCYSCDWVLVEKENKARDHDHFTGKYRGAACTRCNMAMKKPKFIPVYFHNLEGYDGHLIINEIAKYGRITCIPHTKENYASFSLILKEGFGDGFEIRFLDSFKFLGKGLGNLVKTLDLEDFKLTKQLFPDLNDEQRELLRRKGVYPYDWVDDEKKMHWRKLPGKKAFHNTLSESDCSDGDYKHAKRVWDSFGMKKFQDYHDLYLKSDILQLADIFEKFRETCIRHYGLDPAWDYTTPGLAWKSMLKFTGVRLKTISDPDMFLFFERAIRGEISVITKRHAVANHKYMDSYDPEKPSVFIMDLDKNNLYGGAECGMLPTGGFKWMTDDELKSWENFGCFLEVDLDIPKHLHDKFNDYPLACERISVGKTTKLVPNLYDKRKYIIHCEELQQCVKYGYKLVKIHRGLKFNQSRWMKPFVDLNTDLRTLATTEFEKDFFKLMNCAVYGKTVENVRNWKDIKLISEGERNGAKRTNKYVSRPNYKGAKQFSDSLTALELGKQTAVMEKPIYVGATILSRSKVMMSKFWYEYAKEKWGDNVKLLMTDTDSLIMEIHTNDFYKDISDDVREWFDTSNYPGPHRKNDPEHEPEDLIPHPSGIPTNVNKKVLEMMKDEAGGKNITHFSGLRPKVYGIQLENGDEIKRFKGIKRYVVGKMTYQEFEDCVLTGATKDKSQNMIRSHDHRIYVERMTKKGLNRDDDKRIILGDGINTLAHGHWRHLTKINGVVTGEIPIPDGKDNLYNTIFNKFQ